MGLGAIASAIGGGVIGGSFFGNKAASRQREAGANYANYMSSVKGDAINQLSPYSAYGRESLSPLSAMILGKKFDSEKETFSPLSEEERMSMFKESPGYQFRLSEALKAVERRNAATGTLLGGNTQKELTQYGENIASEEFQNYITNLMKIAGFGQAADTNIANIITGTGSQIAQANLYSDLASINNYQNISNALFGIAGMGARSAISGVGGQGGAVGGSGAAGMAGGMSSAPTTYNPAYNTQLQSPNYSLTGR